MNRKLDAVRQAEKETGIQLRDGQTWRYPEGDEIRIANLRPEENRARIYDVACDVYENARLADLIDELHIDGARLVAPRTPDKSEQWLAGWRV